MTQVDVSWSALLPLLVLVASSLLVLVTDLFLRGPGRGVLAWLSIAGLVATAAAAVSLWDTQTTTLAGALFIDRYGLFFLLLCCAATAVTMLLSLGFLDQTEIRTGDYYSLLMFSSVGMALMAMAADLLVVFIGLEIMSVAAYALAGMERSRERSTEAALKYFLLGAFASGFLLFGIALLYGATGSTNLMAIAKALESTSVAADPLLAGGLALLLVGFGFKVAAVPFHLWTPDVYEGAPTSVTAFMAVGVKAAAFAAFARLFVDVFGEPTPAWQGILWVVAVLTMTVGNVTAVVQTSLKRMLAFSSIAHAGYLMIGIVVGGAAGGSALLFYLAVYAVMTLGAFAVAVAAGRPDRQIDAIADLAGLGFRSPLLGAAMAVFMLSLAGIPPLAGFVGKLYLFSAAVDAGFVWLTVIGVLNSVVSVYYYAGVLVQMYMVEAPDGGSRKPGLAIALALLLTVGATVVVGIAPSTLLQIAVSSFAGLV